MNRVFWLSVTLFVIAVRMLLDAIFVGCKEKSKEMCLGGWCVTCDGVG